MFVVMTSGERKRRQAADAWAWLRERQAAKRDTEPNWRTEPEIWSIWKAHQLQNALPPAVQPYITMSAGVMRMSDGTMVPVIARSGRSHSVRKEIHVLRGGADLAHDGYRSNGELILRRDESVHAEVRMLEHAEREGATLVAVAAGRPVCEPCVNSLDAGNAPIASRFKEPYQERPNLRRDEAPSFTTPAPDPNSGRRASGRDETPHSPRPLPKPKPPRWNPPNQPPPNQPGRGGHRGPRQ